MTLPAHSTLSPFATEVIEGLSKPDDRRLSSKYFYDERGTALFRQIMDCPEYYLTDAEAEIYRECADQILQAIGTRSFDLIELGAGDGTKTQLLIERFLAGKAEFTYRPIDLSGSALTELGKLIRIRWPRLDFQPVEADYFEALDRLGKSVSDRPRLVLFPGANIGNFTPGDAVEVLQRIRRFLQPGDHLLTGFDLKKDPSVVLAAYNDGGGLTAAFNLNLLRRINRELGANFELACWRHWESYDPFSGAARSYLVPIEPQEVKLASGHRFSFRAWEPIQVEISQKYSLREIEGMCDAAGYRFRRHFTERQDWFTDSLWQVPSR